MCPSLNYRIRRNLSLAEIYRSVLKIFRKIFENIPNYSLFFDEIYRSALKIFCPTP